MVRGRRRDSKGERENPKGEGVGRPCVDWGQGRAREIEREREEVQVPFLSSFIKQIILQNFSFIFIVVIILFLL